MNKQIFVFLPLAALLSVFGACKTLPRDVQEPEIVFDSVSLTRIGFGGIDMVATLKIHNNNPFAIPFSDIDWTLFIEESRFLNGVVKGGAKLGADSVSSVDIPFSVSYSGIFALAKTLVDADMASYTINAGAAFTIPLLGRKRFTAEFSGKIPLLKVPVLSFDKILFRSQTAGRIEFVVTLLIENKNSFSFSLDRLDYDLSVNNVPWAKGASPAKLQFPARRTTALPVTVTINYLPLISEIVTLISSPKRAAYRWGGEIELHPAYEGIGSVIIPFVFSGETNFR